MKLREFNFYLLILFTMMIFLLINALRHFQSDTFIASVIANAKGIEKTGDIKNVPAIFKSATPKVPVAGWTWQEHTEFLSKYTFIPSLLVYIIHIITSFKIITSAYLPVPYFISTLTFLAIFRYVIKNKWKGYLSTERSLLVLTGYLSLVSFILFYLVGRFYLIQNVPLNLLWYLMLIYLFIRGIIRRQSSYKELSVMVILYAAMLWTHYRHPLLFIGGALFYLLYLLTLKMIYNKDTLNKHSKRLFYIICLLLIMVSLQNVYWHIGKMANVLAALQVLAKYLKSRFTTNNMFIYAVDPLYTIRKYLTVTYWTMYLVLIFISVFFGIKYYTKKHHHDEIAILPGLNLFVLGTALTITLTYFSYYKRIGAQLIDPWFISIFSGAFFIEYSRRVQFRRRVKQGITVMLLIFAAVITLWAGTQSYRVLFYSGLSTEPVISSLYSENFIINNFPKDGKITISGDHQVLANMYERYSEDPNAMSLYKNWILVNLGRYISIYKDNHWSTYKLYEMVSYQVDVFVFNYYDLTWAMYGDVLPVYLKPQESKDIFKIMLLVNNHIYSSTLSNIFDLRGR